MVVVDDELEVDEGIADVVEVVEVVDVLEVVEEVDVELVLEDVVELVVVVVVVVIKFDHAKVAVEKIAGPYAPQVAFTT